MMAAHSIRVAALGFFGALAVLAGCGKAPASDEGSATVVSEDEVRLDPASPKLQHLAIDTVGTRREHLVGVLPAQLVMNEDRTVRVLSPVTGHVRALLAAPGDRVSAGQPLASILSGDVAQAEGDLEKAEAVLRTASATLARARDLYAHNVISLKDLQQSESEEAQAQAERDRARVRVQQLGVSTSGVSQSFELRSPIRGEVIERNANTGAEVRSDNVTPMFTVSALDTLWLTATFYQHDLAAVRRGQHLVFTTDGFPGREWTATVAYVSGSLDPQTRTGTLRATLPNPGGLLKPQMFGQARLFAPGASELVVVPTAALVTHGEGSVVFVQTAPGRFERRPVTVTDDDGVSASITSGLKPGELVVTRGSLLLAGELSGSH